MINERLQALEIKVNRVEKIAWTIFGMILTKAGIDIAPSVIAMFAG